MSKGTGRNDELLHNLHCCAGADERSSGCEACTYKQFGQECDMICKEAAACIERLEAQCAKHEKTIAEYKVLLREAGLSENKRRRAKKIEKKLREFDGVTTIYNGEYVDIDYGGLFDLLTSAADMIQSLISVTSEEREGKL